MPPPLTSLAKSPYQPAMSIIRLARLLALSALLAALALSACGEEECQVHGENCSSAYKEANNITYGCCAGLSCSAGAISGVPICQ